MIRKENQSKLYFSALVFFYLAVSIFIVFIPEKYRTYEMSLILGQSVMIVPMSGCAVFTRGKIFEEIPFRKIAPANILILILFTILIIPVMVFINAVSMLFVNNEVSGTLSGMSGNGFLPNLLLLAALPAVFEELTFRGMIYGGLKSRGRLYGIILSGFLFGIFHMNVNQFTYAFAMGAVMALLIEATGSIFSTVIVHFVINGNSVAVAQLQKLLPAAESSGEVRSGSVRMLLAVLGGFALIAGTLAFLVFRWLSKRCGTAEHMACIFRKKREGGGKAPKTRRDIFSDGVFILAILLCIFIMVLNEV